MHEDHPRGFQLIGRTGSGPTYPDALSVSDVRCLLDPPESGAGPPDDLTDARRARAAEHVDELSALAERVEWKPLDRSHCRTDAAAFALVLRPSDPIDRGARLHAMVARAYLDASRYAEAYGKVVADTEHARVLVRELTPHVRGMIGDSEVAPAGALEAAYRKGDGPLQRALSIVARFRVEPLEEAQGRLVEATAFFAMLDLVFGALDACGRVVSAHGDVPDVGRLVFVLRLLEVFALATRANLVFDGAFRKRVGNPTTELTTAALKLTGLGADSLDSLLRRIGRSGPGGGAGPELQRWTTLKSADFAAYRTPIHHGDFPSDGYLRDVGLSAATSWPSSDDR